MITRDLRRAIARAVAAAGFEGAAEPGLRPTGTPGRYAASVALTLGGNPRETAQSLAVQLTEERWIDTADVTGPGYLTVTVTPEALGAVADSVTRAAGECVTSDALAGVTVPAPPPGDPLASGPGKEPIWEVARAALAAQLTATLAATAGATVAQPADSGRVRVAQPAQPSPGGGAAGTGGGWHGQETAVRAAVAYAGRDAVIFTLARAVPGKPVRVDPAVIARHIVGNPAYAVKYAHARAASGVRWAATSPEAMPDMEAVPPCLPADPGELALLDALSWLPERVATAARRGRPDEFARYLEDVASVTIDVLSSASHQGSGAAPGSERLNLARAARTGLAAGLGLLGVSAPDRL